MRSPSGVHQGTNSIADCPVKQGQLQDHVTPFLAYPNGVRRIIYTTNAIEVLNSKLRRAARTRPLPQ